MLDLNFKDTAINSIIQSISSYTSMNHTNKLGSHICIDSGDNVGSTTIAKAVADKLGFTYDCEPSKELKVKVMEKLSLGDKNSLKDIVGLFAEFRKERTKLYMGGDIVVDRGFLSTMIYNSGLLNNANISDIMDFTADFHNTHNDIQIPSKYFVLSLDTELGEGTLKARVEARNKSSEKLDIFDKYEASARINYLYNKIGVGVSYFHHIDVTGKSVDEISTEIVAAINW